MVVHLVDTTKKMERVVVVAEIVALATALTLRKNNKITLRKRVQRVLDLDSFLNITKILLKNLLISSINYIM
jgi:hypothetical protein